jgi:ABC-2 type transport system permease protein
MLGLLLSLLPAFILSGFAFPLGSIPEWLQVISCAFPARFMVTISRGVFLKGAGFDELWPQLAALGAYAVVVLAIAVLLDGRRRR